MGIFKKNMLTGLIGPLVFSVVKNRQIVRKNVAKGKIKQSTGTKKAANTFGMASSLGSYLRLIHKHNIGSLHDSGMALRMTNTINHILIYCRDSGTNSFNFMPDSFGNLSGFDLNILSPLSDSLLISPVITHTKDLLTVAFTEAFVSESLNFPVRSYACQVTVSVSLFRLAEGLMCDRPQNQNFTIEKRQSFFNNQKLKFDVPDGCLYVVSVFLKYYSPVNGLDIMVNSKKFSPAGIIAAHITPGIFREDPKYKWEDMGQLKFPSKEQFEMIQADLPARRHD
jgi:hypothetical protein